MPIDEELLYGDTDERFREDKAVDEASRGDAEVSTI